MSQVNFLIGKVLSTERVESTEYGERLICYMNLLKTNLVDFQYASQPIRVVLWRNKVQQFQKAYAKTRAPLIMVSFDKYREDEDQFGNKTQVIRASEVSRVTDNEYVKFYCQNSLGQYDPYSILIS
jgi:hypothetical protein